MFFFFFNDTATTEIYTLSLHDALPICEERLEDARQHLRWDARAVVGDFRPHPVVHHLRVEPDASASVDRKSTRLNSSHSQISYAVFCLKKKNKSANRYLSLLFYRFFNT